MTPSVSILLPVWNAEQTLEACLRSAQRQTLKEWECVVVDDGSSDGSVELAQQIASSDRRIRVVATEHLGLVSTLNTGIDHCEAPLIARMDADDLMHRTRLEQQKSTLDAASDLCGVGSHVRLFPRRIPDQIDERPLPGESSQVRKGRGGYESWLNSITSRDEISREAYVECPIAHPTLMLRRDTLANYRYRDMGWAEDYDLVLRLLAQGLSPSSQAVSFHGAITMLGCLEQVALILSNSSSRARPTTFAKPCCVSTPTTCSGVMAIPGGRYSRPWRNTIGTRATSWNCTQDESAIRSKVPK
jgi:glycosyltransferase involved in cell wall biosynthesis